MISAQALKNIKASSRELMNTQESIRDSFLESLSGLIWESREKILEGNKKDLEEAKKKGLEEAFMQRLALKEDDLKKIIERIDDIKNMRANLGEIVSSKNLKNGLKLDKVKAPLGVIFVIYEARPEVTIDTVSLCIKSGNAVILKGGSEALNSNKALYNCILEALRKSGLNEGMVTFIDTSDRKVTDDLLKQNDFIDLVIARGGYDLVRAVTKNSTITVLAHSAGGARIFVDKTADLEMAKKIIINSKITKPAACNSLDTVLVHKDTSEVFIKELVKEFSQEGVKVLGDEEVAKIAGVEKTTDWDKEFLSLVVSIKIVSGVEEAIDFINEHGKNHTEGIISKDEQVIQKFLDSVDAAATFVNSSTRLHDGGVFEMGAEMGISTNKLHARGPVGLDELSTYKWQIYGNGQTR